MKKPFIPFWLLPGSWGLQGETRQKAQIEYEVRDPYERSVKLAELKYGTDLKKLQRAKLDIEANFGKIDDYAYDRARIELEYEKDSVEYRLASLEVEYHHDKIDELEYEKTKATLKGEPYVKIINSSFDPSKGIQGVYFELDWNSAWIEMLKANGYQGVTDEMIVDQWFEDVCSSSVNEKINNEPVPFNSRRGAARSSNGPRTDYS